MFMNYYCYILFIPMLIISSLMSFIMNSWISLWMIMEISLLSMILLMLFDKLMKYEMLMKYFLFQSFNSYLYLINVLGLFMNNFQFSSMLIMNFSMLMKLSLVPFHFWYLKILINMNWINIFFFTIINKIIPLMIMNNIMNFFEKYIYFMNFILLIFSSLVSSFMGINLNNLKLIMGYSSMIQISWIIIIMNFNETISLIYFFIYTIISLNLYMNFYNLNLNNLIQLNNMKIYNKNMFFMFMIMLMSLSGIPPMFGFLMKWIAIQTLMYLNISFLFIIILIFNSLISMFFYFRIMFNSLMNFYYLNKMNIKFINFYNKFNYKLMLLNWLSLTMLIFYQLI